MKTIEDLLDELNENVIGYDPSPYYVNADKNGLVLMYYSQTLIMFMRNGWRIKSGMSTISDEKQKMIMEFAMSTTYKDWFPQNKYNIVIGEGECVGTVAAYCAMDDDVYVVDNRTEPEQLKDGAYQFTEEEIDNFKIKLSNKFAEIVNLGKVEVKDD